MSFPIATATVDMRAAIEGQVSTCWVTDCSQSAANVSWGNAPIDRSANGYYLRATVLVGESVPAGIGEAGTDHKPGVLQLDFFGPKNTGDAALIALADKFKVAFQRSNADGIHCWAIDGPREVADSARSRQTMRVRFLYVETLT